MKTVLLPVKDFGNAKQRLAAALDASTRAGLARAMCMDVLSAVARTRAAERVIVFTAADEVIQMARPFGFDVVIEKSVDGHSAAVNHMVSEMLSSSSRLISIASDLPRLVASEIDFALAFSYLNSFRHRRKKEIEEGRWYLRQNGVLVSRLLAWLI